MDPDSARQLPKAGETPVAGSLVAGKYRILRTLGEGGMGIVVEARHIHLDQRVAIKFLRGIQAEDSRNVARFRREARAAAKVKSDHVAHVYDVGILDDGTRYLVMEYLEGCDLALEMARSGRLPIGQTCTIAVQLLDAISRAHEVGIVHRDLKPENIFLVRQTDGSRRVKVVDFGISKLDDTKGGLKLTGTSELMGTPFYMAPEQMATPELVDGRADIWSIGCVLYEMLSGELPFDARSTPEICTLVISQDPRHLCDVAPDIPQELGEIVMRCLKRDVDERVATAAELSGLLRPYATGPSIPSRSFVSGVSGIPSHTISVDTNGLRDLSQTSGDSNPFRPRRRLLPWAVGALLFVGGLWGAAAWGVLPIHLGSTFVEAPQDAPEIPSVGAAQIPEKAPGGGEDEDELEVSAEIDVAAPKEEGDAPAVPSGTVPLESGPSDAGKPSVPTQSISTQNASTQANKLPRRPTRATQSPAAATPPSAPKKTTVAAPYEEFAEFGGRR